METKNFLPHQIPTKVTDAQARPKRAQKRAHIIHNVGRHCGVIARKRILLFRQSPSWFSTLGYNDLIVTQQRKGKVEKSRKTFAKLEELMEGLP